MEKRKEKGIVEGDEREDEMKRLNIIRKEEKRWEIENNIGRIGRGLDKNERKKKFRKRILGWFIDGGIVKKIRKRERIKEKIEEGIRKKSLSEEIKWMRMKDEIEREKKREKSGGNGGNEGREKGWNLRKIIERKKVIKNIDVRVVEEWIEKKRKEKGRRIIEKRKEIEEIE